MPWSMPQLVMSAPTRITWTTWATSTAGSGTRRHRLQVHDRHLIAMAVDSAGGLRSAARSVAYTRCGGPGRGGDQVHAGGGEREPGCQDEPLTRRDARGYGGHGHREEQPAAPAAFRLPHGGLVVRRVAGAVVRGLRMTSVHDSIVVVRYPENEIADRTIPTAPLFRQPASSTKCRPIADSTWSRPEEVECRVTAWS